VSRCVKCSNNIVNCKVCEFNGETIECLTCTEKYKLNDKLKCDVALVCEEGKAISADL